MSSATTAQVSVGPTGGDPRTRPKPPGTAVLVLVAALTFATTFATYSPVAGLFFYSDDFCWLVAADRAHGAMELELPKDVNGHFRPLAELLWLLWYGWFALDAGAYHLATLAVHALTAAAVACLCGRLLESWRAAAIGGITFGVSFSHRTVPLWISAAPDLLLGLCAAVALAALVGRRPWPWLAIAAATLSLLAKETALLLVMVLPLVAPSGFSRRWFLWMLATIGTALAVPHVVASLLSSYSVERFALGAHVPWNVAATVSGLLVPWVGEDVGGAVGAALGDRAPLRVVLGTILLVVLTVIASRRLRLAHASRWLGAVLVCALLPALATGSLEPRWLYLPAVLLAPLMASAGCVVVEATTRHFGVRVAGAVLSVLLVGHVVVHGALVRAKIERGVRRDSWVRSLLGAAATSPPQLASGSAVAVMIPANMDHRYWPLGVTLWTGLDVDVRPFEVRSIADGAADDVEAVLDGASERPRWLPVNRDR